MVIWKILIQICFFKQYQKQSHSLISSEKSLRIEKLLNSQCGVHIFQNFHFHLKSSNFIIGQKHYHCLEGLPNTHIWITRVCLSVSLSRPRLHDHTPYLLLLQLLWVSCCTLREYISASGPLHMMFLSAWTALPSEGFLFYCIQVSIFKKHLLREPCPDYLTYSNRPHTFAVCIHPPLFSH